MPILNILKSGLAAHIPMAKTANAISRTIIPLSLWRNNNKKVNPLVTVQRDGMKKRETISYASGCSIGRGGGVV